MRLVVMGTAAFTVPSLELLARGPHRVLAVYTQPPRPAGRGHKERRTAVHESALRLGLEVLTPGSLRGVEAQEIFRSHAADLAVVGAYGLLLPRPVLEAPRLGCINLHASLLPRWRGAAPIQRAIMAGDEESGVSIFQMEEGLDTGPVYAMEPVPIGPQTTAGDLHDRLAATAAAMLPGVLEGLEAGTLRAVPQPEQGVIYAHKIRKEEARLDLARDAVELDRQIRAFSPTPGSWCEARGERLLLLEAEPVDGSGEPGTVLERPLTVACGRGALRVTRVQRAGRRPMSAEELQRGFALPPGTRLG
ncbi:methionyl-tRNA formyltransferase [Marinimicrococcus flavescens]|uniref:Methionyl-tRNA formyltransferase n=1 Tax=Marinimicrococcus flavescens TaxID=3031815 RepID=A0AAP3V0T5_9PROT|nr:methionyl-tRNA formyltransferase [Marinimicrococcus flavescens]